MLGYKKRSELAEKSKVFVKLTDADLRWLIPLAERTKKNATPLPHKSFTIKDMDGRWETLIYVQEIQPGKIRVDGYAPIDRKNGKKNAVVNIYETPYFSITSSGCTTLPKDLLIFFPSSSKENPCIKTFLYGTLSIEITPAPN